MSVASAVRIDVRREGAVTVIRPAGRLDSGRIGQLEKVIRDELAEGRDRLVLDFGETLFISSSALRVLLVTHRAVSPAGVLLVAGLMPHIADMVRTAGFDTLIEIRGDVGSAVEEARPDAPPDAEPASAPPVEPAGASRRPGGRGPWRPEGAVLARHALWIGAAAVAGGLVAGWSVAVPLAAVAVVCDAFVCFGPAGLREWLNRAWEG